MPLCQFGMVAIRAWRNVLGQYFTPTAPLFIACVVPYQRAAPARETSRGHTYFIPLIEPRADRDNSASANPGIEHAKVMPLVRALRRS